MKNPLRWILAGVAFCVIAAGAYLWWRGSMNTPPTPPVARVVAQPEEVKPPPQSHFPVPQAADAPSLPALDQSDSSLRTVLAELLGRKAFEELFVQRDIVRRIVATVDALPHEKLPRRMSPVRSASGSFLVAVEGAEPVIGATNAARYLPYMAMINSVDSGSLVAAYVRHYPLFEQAYRELGYPDRHFNDRLVQVIDHLLAAPDLVGPVRLVQRKVLYEYADDELEARSAGQKVMMRIGPQNSAKLKTKLRDIRRQLTGQAPAN